jgi:hypothetical protein
MAATNLIGTYDTALMLEAINATPRPRTALRERVFGGRVTAFETQYVLCDWLKGKRSMAPFVSRVIGGKLVEKLAMTTKRYEPPMVAPRGIFRGDEAFERMPGEVIGGAASPDDRAQATIARQLDMHDQLITRREEWMIAKMLTTGVIPIVGEGVSDEIDLGHTLTDVLSGVSLWSATTAEILANVRDWRRSVVQASGITPDTMILGADAADAFLADETIQETLDKKNVMVGMIDVRQLPNGIEYLGTINGVDFFGYDEWYIDDDSGVETPMVPADTVVVFASADRNPGARMLYGAYYDVEDAATYAGARIPRTWTDKGANARFMELVTFPLPFVPDVDSWLIATVL